MRLFKAWRWCKFCQPLEAIISLHEHVQAWRARNRATNIRPAFHSMLPSDISFLASDRQLTHSSAAPPLHAASSSLVR
eukprot:scaffold23370_cov13-Tisochrysis_lutea.AAC.1